MRSGECFNLFSSSFIGCCQDFGLARRKDLMAMLSLKDA